MLPESALPTHADPLADDLLPVRRHEHVHVGVVLVVTREDPAAFAPEDPDPLLAARTLALVSAHDHDPLLDSLGPALVAVALEHDHVLVVVTAHDHDPLLDPLGAVGSADSLHDASPVSVELGSAAQDRDPLADALAARARGVPFCSVENDHPLLAAAAALDPNPPLALALLSSLVLTAQAAVDPLTQLRRELLEGLVEVAQLAVVDLEVEV